MRGVDDSPICGLGWVDNGAGVGGLSTVIVRFGTLGDSIGDVDISFIAGSAVGGFSSGVGRHMGDFGRGRLRWVLAAGEVVVLPFLLGEERVGLARL